jgi:hypothetical protein
MVISQGLKKYFDALKALEAALPDEDAVVVSLETNDGGAAGVMSEAPRRIACRLVVEGRARLATEEEKAAYHEREAERRLEWEEAELSKRIQVHVLADGEKREIRGLRPRSN